ncbi:MAG: hypothetical protein HYZ73_00635 [Elusimicrobia bacterium]|nr:hypothetical protein [Elusimicrobiota bacterium]
MARTNERVDFIISKRPEIRNFGRKKEFPKKDWLELYFGGQKSPFFSHKTLPLASKK